MNRRLNRRHATVLLASSIGAPLTAGAAAPPGFPTRPIRIVVPSGPGGLVDILARLIGQRLTDSTGVPAIVDNRLGSGGIVGTELVARATPDGTTLLMAFPSHSVNPSLYTMLPYDTRKDFTPVIAVATVNLVLVVNAAFPARSVGELLDICRKQPGKINYATVGEGSLGHLAASAFCRMANIQAVQIPYKSVPQAATALLSGEVQFFFDTVITAMPQINAGKYRAMGVSGLKRTPGLPSVPPIAEAGVPSFDIVGHNGLLAPAGTPAQTISALNAAIQQVMDLHEVREQLANYDIDPIGGSPEKFSAILQADMDKWARVVAEAGIPRQ